MLCYSEGLDKEGMNASSELLCHIQLSGGVDDPLYLKIYKFHRNNIAGSVAAGGDVEKYKWNLRQNVVGRIIMPSNRLLNTLDLKGTSKYDRRD